MQTLTGEGWSLKLPDGLIAKDHVAYGYESGAIARGWVGDDAPITVIVQVTTPDRGFNEWVGYVHRTWLEVSTQRRIEVPGAKDAVRTDGLIEFDGLGAKDDRENCTTLLAKRGRNV